jgi:alkyl hydroperoxide reductase subunit AhpF|tara:strand:- start:479 stop:718 length:240 start_codon:yes stop_codon:yes gene_type:complete
MTRKRKTNHEIDPDEAIRALAVLKNDPNFKAYIAMRESLREDVIRQLQTQSVIDSTNRHFMMSGKLEAIDEELDMFYKL